MFLVGQKVKFGQNYGPKSKQGIITYAADQFGWYNIRDNKGHEHKVVPFNQIENRESGWRNS